MVHSAWCVMVHGWCIVYVCAMCVYSVTTRYEQRVPFDVLLTTSRGRRVGGYMALSIACQLGQLLANLARLPTPRGTGPEYIREQPLNNFYFTF